MKTIGTIAIVLMCTVGFSSFAKDSPSPKQIQETLSAAPAPELPAAAAKLVQETKFRDRDAITINVVKAAATLNAAATPAVVGAIAKAVPEMAAVAAGAGAAAQPKLASAIAKAASAAAPARAGKIVAAVCVAVPNDYRNVAISAAEAAPTSGKEILKSVGTTVPSLKPYIDHELAGYGLGVPSVAGTLNLAIGSARTTASTATMGAPGGPPLIPTSGTQNDTNPNGNEGPTIKGGRNYARP